jgi:hypothetical protein
MTAQRIEQRRDAAAADERHDKVNAIGRMKFSEQLVADSGFARSIRQQRRVEKRDERLWHRFDPTIRGSAQNRTQDGSRLNRRVGAGLRSTDRLIDLLDKLSGERNADRNAVGIIHASYGSLHNPAEMKREPIRRLCGPHTIADRVEVVAEITKL